MVAKLQDYYISRVFTALANIWGPVNTPNNYTAVANLTAAALRNAINEINYTSNVRAVVGTRRGLAPITQFAGFHTDGVNTVANNEGISEIYRTGWVGRWYGAPIVALDQIWNNPIDYVPQIPNRYVLVIADAVGEFITYGEPKWKEWTEMQPTPPDWFVEVYTQFGLLVDNAIGIYVIDITSLA